MKNNESFIKKVKDKSQKAFVGIGNIAVGNGPTNNCKRGNTNFAPFSFAALWSYETPMPKRKSK